MGGTSQSRTISRPCRQRRLMPSSGSFLSFSRLVRPGAVGRQDARVVLGARAPGPRRCRTRGAMTLKYPEPQAGNMGQTRDGRPGGPKKVSAHFRPTSHGGGIVRGALALTAHGRAGRREREFGIWSLLSSRYAWNGCRADSMGCGGAFGARRCLIHFSP